MNFYNGSVGLGNVDGTQRFPSSLTYMLAVIKAGNTEENQNANDFNAFTSRFFRQMPHVPGMRLPVKNFNVSFTEGSFTSDAPMFKKNVSHFTFKKKGYNVSTFEFSEKEIADQTEVGIDLMIQATEKVMAVMEAYKNNYLPSMTYIALLAGSSMSTAIPALNVSGAYVDNLGALRGERVTDFLNKPDLSTPLNNNRNHYLCKVGATIDESDILRAHELITEKKKYSKGDIVCLINSYDLQKMKVLFKDTLTEDEYLIGDRAFKSIVILGIIYIPFNYIDKGITIYLDSGKMNGQLGIRAVRKTPTQRGVVLQTSKRPTLFDVDSIITEINGGKLHIFPESWNIFARESIVLMDIKNTEAGGVMDTDSETFLAELIKSANGAFNREAL